jgi:hypothetical protein
VDATPVEQNLVLTWHQSVATMPRGGEMRASAQPVRLTGRIVRGGVPVAGAEVRLSPGAMRRRTDARGRFAFAALPPGSYRLEVYQGSQPVLAEEVALGGGPTEIELTIP